MKQLLVFIFMCFIFISYAQNSRLVNSNRLILLNNIDTLIMNYNEFQSFKTFGSESLNVKVVDKYISLFSKNASIVNHIKPSFIKTFNGENELNSIKLKQIKISEFKEMVINNFVDGIGFKLLNKNISFSKIDSNVLKIVIIRQSKISNSLGIRYNITDTVLMKINVNKNDNSLKIVAIDFINPKSYQFDLINDIDFDQIPDEIDTLSDDKIKKLQIQKPIKKLTNKRDQKIGFIFSSGTNYQWFRTNNGLQKPYLITFPKNTDTPPQTFILDTYYKYSFFKNKMYVKTSLNLMFMNYELYLLSKPDNFQFDKLKLTSDRFISLGITLATGYVFNLTSKLALDLDFGLLISKIVNSNSEIKFYDKINGYTKNASFTNQYAYFLVSNPSLSYKINDKSTFLFGVNAMFGQSINNDYSDTGFILLDNNKVFTPLENSTAKSIIRNVGLNVGLEYKIN